MKELVFVAAKRTPFGAFGGSLAALTATDLAEHAARACLQQSGIAATEIDSVCVGNVIQANSDAAYLARHVGLRLGVSQDKPALTVNRLCGSGFEAIAQGAYQLMFEGARTVLVGGSETMSQVPYAVRGARFGVKMGHQQLEDLLQAGLSDAHVQLPMALTAENLAVQYGISREQCDDFAVQGQQRVAAGYEKGAFKDELFPVPFKKGTLERDEHPRPTSTKEGLAKLPALFKKDGTVTAGTASGMCDGAAFLILTTAENAKAKGWKVLGKLHAWAAVGCDPKIMGIGPVPATHKALARWSENSGKSRSVQDFKLIEVNEAFAAQYLAVEKELKLPRDRTNVHGGAIAIGHPLGASGARLVGHLLYSLRAAGGGAGLASACIGGGQGMSMIVEVA